MYQAKTPHTYHLLMEQAMEQLEARNSRVARIKAPGDWQSYRDDLRGKLQKSLGAFPGKTPLNAKITSTVESDGITVENILYESLPGYYVSASFFRKKELAGRKLPVIVFCSGHSANGYRSEAYQIIMLNYAKKGFAVLAFDPVGQGERVQYRKADGKPAMGTTHDHSYSGSGAFLLGYSPAKYFIWDGIRAIDYLETRRDVDTGRIGIAGRSGGGTQSSYIAAIDDRVTAAAPECYITTYEMLLKSSGPQDAEQVFLSGIANGIDIPDLLHMRAPKPTLVVTTTNDIFSIQGVQDMKEELSRLYRMNGKEEDFQVVEDNAGHASTKLNREACYRFFSKYLNNPCNTSDEDVKPFPDEQLYASKGGDVFGIPGSRRLGEVIAASEGESRHKTEIGGEALAGILNYKSSGTQKSSSIFSGTILARNYSVDKYLVKAPAGYYLPVLVFRNGPAAAGEGKVALYLDDKGKASDTTMILGLLKKYSQVVCADLSGIGELKEYYNWQGDASIDKTPLNLWYLALLTNQTLAQYRVGEIDALCRFIGAKLPAAGVSGLASGTTTTDLLHWASVNRGKLDQLMLINPILSFRSLVGAKSYKPVYLLGTPGSMLSSYDLPDLYAQFTAGKLRLINPVDSNGEVLEKTAAGIDARIPRETLVFVKDAQEGI
ncbi:MAG: hypothetical protein ABS46_20820 [Cytophagaceae bacterium SCN 52-12]|nr:MAG: hypothetical protein ABS46_20820 [Cytophagaceae bacterium SCN 52-12]